MMRVRTPADRSEEDDERLEELIRMGDAITIDHEALIQEHDRIQRDYSERYQNLTRNWNPYLPEALRLANEQINFDYATKQQLENHYERGKNEEWSVRRDQISKKKNL